MAEEAAVLLELADVSARLRALAASEVFAMVVASLSNEPRAEVIETLRDLAHTVRAMRESLEGNDHNYGLQR
jgi:hypothetical protein